jgi:hypothetical protein
MTALPRDVALRRPATTVAQPAAVPNLTTAPRPGLVLHARLVEAPPAAQPAGGRIAISVTNPFRGESSTTFVLALFVVVFAASGLLGVLLSQL